MKEKATHLPLTLHIKGGEYLVTEDLTLKFLDVELENPCLGGDLEVGKSVIHEIFTEISRPRDPLSPPKRGIIVSL